jgi:hypothetical protein
MNLPIDTASAVIPGVSEGCLVRPTKVVAVLGQRNGDSPCSCYTVLDRTTKRACDIGVIIVSNWEGQNPRL